MLTGAKSRCVCIFYFLSYGHLWGGLICYSVLPWSSSDLIGKNRGHAGGKPESHLYSWWELSCSTCVAYICWQMSLLILSAGVKRFTGPSNLTTLAHEHWTRADYCLAGQSLLPEGSKVETICAVGQINGVSTSCFQIARAWLRGYPIWRSTVLTASCICPLSPPHSPSSFQVMNYGLAKKAEASAKTKGLSEQLSGVTVSSYPSAWPGVLCVFHLCWAPGYSMWPL